MTANGGRPREDNGLALAEALLEQVEDDLVVEHGVGVVDAHGVRAIVEDDVGVGNTLAEVGLRIQIRVDQRPTPHTRRCRVLP